MQSGALCPPHDHSPYGSSGKVPIPMWSLAVKYCLSEAKQVLMWTCCEGRWCNFSIFYLSCILWRFGDRNRLLKLDFQTII